MLSKNEKKLIRSLEHKKYRRQQNLFVVEGYKSVAEFMKHAEPAIIVATEEWQGKAPESTRIEIVSDKELASISFLQHPQQVLALFPLVEEESAPLNPAEHLVIALDGVQDPGNLGTIIRIADWFGIKQIVCSRDTVDAYNPKTVQATMGSLSRVHILYTDLPEWLRSVSAPIYGTLLDGENIYKQNLTPHGVIVMGNEGKGLSAEVRSLVNKKLLIPSFASGDTAESLNVAIATAITCSEFRRK